MVEQAAWHIRRKMNESPVGTSSPNPCICSVKCSISEGRPDGFGVTLGTHEWRLNPHCGSETVHPRTPSPATKLDKSAITHLSTCILLWVRVRTEYTY